MDVGLGNNYFLSLYRYLRRADFCLHSTNSVEIEQITLADFNRQCPKPDNLKSVDALYVCLGEKFRRPPASVASGLDQSTGTGDVHGSSHTVPGGDSSPVVSDKDSPQSTKLDSQTTIISSIATQEKLFFTNFHNAAQQLSLLGIKAVGLATQIQAIRGHMMMLKLIDQHIGQLNDDYGKYTGLLQAALKQLETVTESSKTSP